MKAYNLRTAFQHRNEVTELYLHHCGLKTLPDAVFRFPNLKKLEFSGNDLMELPKAISELEKLEWLNLSGNCLKNLPVQLFELSNLKNLDLSANRLTELPAGIAGLNHLTTLRLNANFLEYLPPELSRLKRLRQLWVSQNRLTRLPAGLGKLSDLHELSFAENKVKTLPGSFANLIHLERFDASGNRIKELPRSLPGAWGGLNVLNLAANRLKLVPDSLGNCRMLSRLDLSGNLLEGMPESIGELMWLKELNIAGNKFGAFPLSLKRIKYLRHIDLSGNDLRNIPGSLEQMSRVEFLDLSGNQISRIDSLPASLRGLSLSHNRLSSFPVQLCRLEHLKKLDITHNRLNKLPECISQLKTLEVLALGGNEFRDLPEEVLGLSALQKITGAGSPNRRKRLLQLLSACRKTSALPVALPVYFSILNGREEAWNTLSLSQLSEALCFPLKALRLSARKHLILTRGHGKGQIDLRPGSTVSIIGHSGFDEGKLRSDLAKYGITLLERNDYQNASYLLIGDRLKSPPALSVSQVFLSPSQLNNFFNHQGGRYLVNNASPEQLSRIRELLLHQDPGNVRLAVQLLHGGGVPEALLTELFAVWKLTPPGKTKKSLRLLLELNLPEQDRFILSSRKSLSIKLPLKELEKNIMSFTGQTSLDREVLTLVMAKKRREKGDGKFAR